MLSELGSALQNRRRGKLTSSLILLHDNVHPHTAALSKKNILDFRWKLCDHPSYSPDLAPNNNVPFLNLKLWLGGSINYSVELQCRTVKEPGKHHGMCLELNGDCVKNLSRYLVN